jgi:hypothetical protein
MAHTSCPLGKCKQKCTHGMGEARGREFNFHQSSKSMSGFGGRKRKPRSVGLPQRKRSR